MEYISGFIYSICQKFSGIVNFAKKENRKEFNYFINNMGEKIRKEISIEKDEFEAMEKERRTLEFPTLCSYIANILKNRKKILIKNFNDIFEEK